MAEKDTSMKGEEGENTGSQARKLVNKAQKKGLTNEEIGNKSNRDENTISQIDKGKIKNPPKSIIPKLKKAASAPVTKETMDGLQKFHNENVKKRGQWLNSS